MRPSDTIRLIELNSSIRSIGAGQRIDATRNTLTAAIAAATPLSMLGHIVNVTISVVAFRSSVPWMPLALWALASYAVSVFVLIRWVAGKRQRAETIASARARSLGGNSRATLFGAILAAPWGVLAVWLLGDLPREQELILVAICLGMSASGSVLLAATYSAALTYMATVLAPVALKCFLVLDGREYFLLGLLAVSYSAFLVNCIFSCAKLFTDRSRAVDELSNSLHATENARVELERANRRFEAALQDMPQGLVMYDSQDRLEAFNRRWLEIYSLSTAEIQLGMHFFDVMRLRASRSLEVPDDADRYLEDLKNKLRRLGQYQQVLVLKDDHHIQITVRARKDGSGWVATHEDITQRRSSEDKIEKLAHFDSLTGLANRNLFKLRIEESLANYRTKNASFAVLLLDLDRFKAVNDALGHQAGDMLLKEVADRIKAAVRDIDVPARLGGDEFALIVQPGQGALKEGADTLANRLIKTISSPYQIDGHPVVIGCSIGVAIAPEHGERLDEILRNADLALYKSKNSGRSCANLYSPELKAEADRRNVLEIELREAIWREEIEVFYQPTVELSSGRIKSVEALARWRHKTRGFISPAEFIPVAEAAGLIVELGNRVLAKACRDARGMPDDIKVAVNLSAVQFAKGEIVDSALSAMVDAGLPEGRLELEITESIFLIDSEQNLKALERLRGLGVSIALDDFGVGYSSLSYLTAFPFDKLKIDKSFIDRFNRSETEAVLTSIVQLARSLNLSVVAEGIETHEQVEKLHSLGIEFGQGYFFAKPVPLAELKFERIVGQGVDGQARMVESDRKRLELGHMTDDLDPAALADALVVPEGSASRVAAS